MNHLDGGVATTLHQHYTIYQTLVQDKINSEVLRMFEISKFSHDDNITVIGHLN